jgi:hypothetical protein
MEPQECREAGRVAELQACEVDGHLRNVTRAQLLQALVKVGRAGHVKFATKRNDHMAALTVNLAREPSVE